MSGNAPNWHELRPGLWQRTPPTPRGASCVLRQARCGGYEMSVAGGPWLAAGDALRRAQEHAGGHACAADDERLRGNCGECQAIAKRREMER